MILGASDGYFGTARAQLALRNTLFLLNAFVLPQPEVYIPMAQDKFNEAGELTDRQAFEYLSPCNPATREIMGMAENWDWYHCAFSHWTEGSSEPFVQFQKDRTLRSSLSDDLAQQLGIPDQDVTCFVGVDTQSCRGIGLNMYYEGQLVCAPQPQTRPVELAYAFLHPKWEDDNKKLAQTQEFTNHRLGLE